MEQITGTISQGDAENLGGKGLNHPPVTKALQCPVVAQSPHLLKGLQVLTFLPGVP